MQLTNIFQVALFVAFQASAAPVAESEAFTPLATNALFKRAECHPVSCGRKLISDLILKHQDRIANPLTQLPAISEHGQKRPYKEPSMPCQAMGIKPTPTSVRAMFHQRHIYIQTPADTSIQRVPAIANIPANSARAVDPRET